ncbi:hypothetical protein [Paraburkholderia sp. SIMBA_027]|uniref:hypothetical protein n=1 Tax=Paraburkholderia sp. SIMBA_027 TaxID=3085770 RepID=UPI00397E3F3B
MNGIVTYFNEVNWQGMWDYFAGPTVLVFGAVAVLWAVVWAGDAALKKLRHRH